MNKEERSLFQTFPLLFTVQGVNICFSLFKFPRDVSIQPLKFKQKKYCLMWPECWIKLKPFPYRRCFHVGIVCVCVFMLIGMHAGVFVCDKALSCSHSSKPPQAQGSICSPLFSICPVPLSLSQSLIQGDYELTSHHHSFSLSDQHDLSALFMISSFKIKCYLLESAFLISFSGGKAPQHKATQTTVLNYNIIYWGKHICIKLLYHPCEKAIDPINLL